MREFKFRAWVSDIERLYHVISLSSENVLVWEHPCAKTAKIKNKKGVFRLGDGVEVMQYTGLKDKNDVEIYECDILRVGDILCMITFENGGFRMITSENQDVSPAIQDRLKRFHIIGNAYENKEILKWLI